MSERCPPTWIADPDCEVCCGRGLYYIDADRRLSKACPRCFPDDSLPTAADVRGILVGHEMSDDAALAPLREAVREIVQTYDTWQAAEATGPITWRQFDEIHNLCAAFWTAFRDNVPRLRALVEET